MKLDQKIEALLFFKTEPLSFKEIAKLLKTEEDKVSEAVEVLEEKLSDRGLQLIRNGKEVLLGTHADAHALIEKLRKEELSTPLSKAALETLTIVLYKNGITKNEIDYIRGVNSGFILRNLSLRGLVERVENPKDKRSPLYRPTFDALAHIGISNAKELPEYDMFMKKLEEIEEQYNEENQEEITSDNNDE